MNARLERIRQRIDDNYYDDDEVVDATVDNLHAAMRRVESRAALAGGQGRDEDDVYDGGTAIAFCATGATVFALGVLAWMVL